MKIKIKEIEPNPFKKHIQNGKLNQNRIEMFKESIHHGTLPENFRIRKYNGEYQVCSGHHRLESLKQVKGEDYEVFVDVVDFSDEQMLIDMVRENITQRDTDYHDTREGIVIARDWLQSKAQDINHFKPFKMVKHPQGNDGRFKEKDVTYKKIANFLSKNGKAISYVTVKNYLDVNDKLHPELLEKVRKVTSGNDKKEIDVTVKQAMALSQFPKEEQKDLWKAMQNEEGRPHEYLPKYKEAPEDIKQQVRKGEIRFKDIEDEIDRKELKEEMKKRPKTVFIPNFSQRMKDFDRNVAKLERQIKIFSEIFHSSNFKERYYSLKPKQREVFSQVIFDIKKRIRECNDEIVFFMEQLSDRKILLEEVEK